MDWQQATALSIVLVTAAILAWRWFRPRRTGGHGPACAGCGVDAPTQPREKIILHARKGERPQIIVRPARDRDAVS